MKNNNDEEFQNFTTKIDEVVNILNFMNSTDEKTQKLGIKCADQFLDGGANANDINSSDSKLNSTDFIVRVKEDRTVINKSCNYGNSSATAGDHETTMDNRAFMGEIERDAMRRHQERCERESIAQNLRHLGNQAFRNCEYEKAITMFTKAIDQIKDSPVLYNNRALTYINLNLYKRAIIDCDFVIQKLDEKNLRAWLYRAQCYHCLSEQHDFEKSLNEAKKCNPKDIDYIEKFAKKIQLMSTST